LRYLYPDIKGGVMKALKVIAYHGWALIIISVVALVGYVFEWPITVLATIIGIVLVIGLATAIVDTREKELEKTSQKLRQMTGYFYRRFTGDSSLSIFAIIDSLFKTDDHKLWDWARACDVAERVFNTWCSSFTSRLEVDTKTGRFTIYLRSYLNELWLMTNLYYEFVEQFYDIAQKVAIPAETLEQYHRFVVEYNSFAEQFRELIGELKQVARTEVEPPSVKMAHEVLTTSLIREQK
jgi:ABC-type multidrug transport system fused ATPase/permease subunit